MNVGKIIPHRVIGEVPQIIGTISIVFRNGELRTQDFPLRTLLHRSEALEVPPGKVKNSDSIRKRGQNEFAQCLQRLPSGAGT